MSKELDALNDAYKKAYDEETKQINADRNAISKLQEKQKESRKKIRAKVEAATRAIQDRKTLEFRATAIYNSLISGLANDQYDAKKVMAQAEKEAKLLL